MAKGQKLNPRQQLFIKEYLIDRNATQAAIRAGYSEKTAEQIGFRLLRNVQIEKAVNSALEKQMKRLDISADRVLQEIACLSFYDPKDFESVNGPEDIKNLPEDVRRAIVGWDWNKNGKFVLKISPKTPSLDQLGRHLKLFTDKLEISGNLTLAERIKAARERIRRKQD
jgi:phage terminase small subunit